MNTCRREGDTELLCGATQGLALASTGRALPARSLSVLLQQVLPGQEHPAECRTQELRVQFYLMPWIEQMTSYENEHYLGIRITLLRHINVCKVCLISEHKVKSLTSVRLTQLMQRVP